MVSAREAESPVICVEKFGTREIWFWKLFLSWTKILFRRRNDISILPILTRLVACSFFFFLSVRTNHAMMTQRSRSYDELWLLNIYKVYEQWTWSDQNRILILGI